MENESSNSGSNDKSRRIRNLIPTSFALTIVFFFFTFIEFKCKEGKETDSVTGINLVMGNGLETFTEMFPLPNKFGFGSELPDPQPPNVWAIITLVASVIGLVVFFLKLKKSNIIGVILGIIGVFSLLLLQLFLIIKMEEKFKDNYIVVFKFGYWAAMLSLIMASVISFILLIKDKTNANQSE